MSLPDGCDIGRLWHPIMTASNPVHLGDRASERTSFVQFRHARRLIGLIAACLIALQILSLTALGSGWGSQPSALAVAPGNPAFERTWARTDKPVSDLQVSRTWMWGPQANTGILQEPYAEAPGGMREVQYFDKSRMEITTDTSVPLDSAWYVTNGLLVNELVSGMMQVGDEEFVPAEPARVGVAGDPDDTTGPTYATFGPLRELPPLADGAPVIQRLSRDGTIVDDPSLAWYGVTAAWRATEPGLDHQVASVFLDFMRSTGVVYVDGQFVTDRLFEDDFYATGYPIAEAYWASVTLKGTVQDVLVQCFQRRCLTYTPGNDEGWQVEAGNVGQHYQAWRATVTNEPTPTATATATETQPSDETPTATATQTEEPTNTPSPTATNTAVNSPTPTTPSGGGDEAACLNAEESAFLALINDYRVANGRQPLTASRKLNIASYTHSLDMGERDYFAHDTLLPLPSGQSGPTFADRIADAGYTGYSYWAENIAAGQPTAQVVFNSWKKSVGHNLNMLNPNLTQIGIGFASVPGSTYTYFWSTDFADGNDSGGCESGS
jgi:uncharacterized protein YkwD